MIRTTCYTATALAVLLACNLSPARAADDDGKDKGPPTGLPEASIASSLPQNGDPSGTRAALAARGITGGLNYIGEVLGNTSGGVKRGSIYAGRAEFYTDIDFDKLSGWKGLTFHVNAYQIHGQGLSTNNLQNLLPVSYIEATPATRLFEVWFEQSLFNDKLSVRFGQLAADSEFATSETAGQFINGTFGWPTSFAANLPSGGAAYPLATPGVRVKIAPSENATLLIGLFNGDPAGPRCRDAQGNVGDPQDCNDHGLDFRLGDDLFAIVEAQVKYNVGSSSKPLPGVLKVGGWNHFGDFNDNRFDAAGVSVAFSGNDPRRRSGKYALYAMVDQQVFAGAGSQSINMFARVTGLQDDRNDVGFYADGGVKFSGFVPGRPNDTFGAAVGYARVADGLRAATRDNVISGAGTLVADYEAVLELSYTAQIIPGWTLQPDFQYVWHPGARLGDDGNGKPIADAAVFGLRTTLNY
jgi:porin